MAPKAKPVVAAAPVKVDTQQLPQKEQSNFKSLLRLYETKQYKKAIKTADLILKKYPNHGETLAMKGLVMNMMKKPEEAHQLVKKGLANNFKSHVCWHVYGLIYRSESNYDQAIKCYQNALKHDPQNIQILKDLSQLQIQRRMYAGFAETRRKILLDKTNNRNNWLAYAIGIHLHGEPEKAGQILDSFLATQDDDSKVRERVKAIDIKEPAAASDDEKRDVAKQEIEKFESRNRALLSFEESELYLYRFTLVLQTGKWAEALAFLDAVSSVVLDSLYYFEQRASLLLKLGRNVEAEAYYRHLLSINSDTLSYHIGLQSALGIAADYQSNTEALKSLYQDLLTTYPKSALVQRLPLDFAFGDAFDSLLEPYVKRFIRKAIPSLFVDLKPLYVDSAKVTQIQICTENALQSLRKDNRFPCEQGDEASPACLLWLLYFAAQHYDHLADYTHALELVDEAIAHTPTTIDLYMLKARIYKHAGSPQRAFACMDQARQYDTADRYLNTKCVRYALRAGMLSKAEDLVSLFLRDDADGLNALTDLQAAWWEYQVASLHERDGNYGKALKYFSHTIRHFTDFYEDQFDFHTYCLRKVTIRAYIDMIHWENQVKGHKFFVRAALGVLRVHLKRFDETAAKARAEKAVLEDATLDEEVKKAFIKKQKKTAAKEKKQLEERRAQDEAAAKKLTAAQAKKGAMVPPDSDPDGSKLLDKDALTESTTMIRELQAFAPAIFDTWYSSLLVYTRRSKWILAWRAFKKARKIQPESALLHVAFAQFVVQLRAAWPELHETVQAVLSADWNDAKVVASDLLTFDLKAFNQQFLTQHQSSLPHRLAAARVLVTLEPSNHSAAFSLVDVRAANGGLTVDSTKLDRVSLSEAVAVHEWIEELNEERASAFGVAVQSIFPFASVFGAVDTPASKAPQQNGHANTSEVRDTA